MVFFSFANLQIYMKERTIKYMGFVTNRANTILNETFAKTYYLGLSTTTPTSSGGNVTEPSSANGYKRAQLSAMGTANNAQIQNTDIIYMGESLAEWGTITHFCIYTSASGGTPIYFGALTSNVAVPSGYVPIFRAGAIKVGLDKSALD